MSRPNGYDATATDQEGGVLVPAGNMLRCGCPLGRPCTCEMGGQRARSSATADYACGECVNCRLNASKAASRRVSSSVSTSSSGSGSGGSYNKRRCIRYNEYMKSQLYDVVELGADCVFRMRRPDWDVNEKSALYTKMRQMRLAMRECHATSTAVIETQNKARKKLNRDLLKAKEMLKNLEELKKAAPSNTRRTAIGFSHVDSDVFDSFSKQLIPAETLLPDVRARLEKVNAIITKEEKSIKIIRQYVFDFAANKLQQSVRDFLRHDGWKRVWSDFKADVQLAAAVEIQAFCRMLQARGVRLFLADLRRNRRKEQAANVICRFFQSIRIARQADTEKQLREARRVAQARKMDAIWKFERVFSSILCRLALLKWREKQRLATAHEQIRTTRSVVTIQRLYRGFRDRLYLKRIRFLKTLSGRVRELVDQFLVSGNFWGFVLEIDADYRRFEQEKRVEEENALTFVSTLLKQRKLEEDQMMQEWFTASAMQSPIVQGLRQTQSTYTDSAGPSPSFPSSESPATSDNGSWSQALLGSPIAADLIALSPNKRKADVFPTDLPAKSIRHAMAEGFAFEDTVAVLRGLQAQMKDLNDVNLVLKALYQRTPLMTNTWKSERMVRQETHPHQLSLHKTISSSAKPHAKPGAKLNRPKGSLNPANIIASGAIKKSQEPLITENLVDSIPGGMKASIARIVLVAAMKSFDPDADGGDGAFALREDCTSDPFESYLKLESPLLKIRREHQVLEAAKPFVQILTENRCWTGYDLLYNVRGVDELVVSWTIPRPLAISIYDVIEQIHHQTVRVGKRNIMREMYISPHFSKFLHERQSNKAVSASKHEVAAELTPPATVTRPPSPAVDDSLKDQIREKLEQDVLKLPIQDVELEAADVLFKAAFLVCDQLSSASSSNSFDTFLDSLVAFQVSGDSLTLRQLIRERVDIAKQVADKYASELKALGMEDAIDLVAQAKVVDSKLEPVLASKVRELLSDISTQLTDSEPGRRESFPKAWTPKKTLAALLEPQNVSRSTAQLSPLIRQGRTAISTLASDKVSKVDIPF